MSKFHKTGEAQQEAEAEEIGGTFDPVFFCTNLKKSIRNCFSPLSNHPHTSQKLRYPAKYKALEQSKNRI